MAGDWTATRGVKFDPVLENASKAKSCFGPSQSAQSMTRTSVPPKPVPGRIPPADMSKKLPPNANLSLEVPGAG